MALLEEQFKQALSNVEPPEADRANAPEAHKDVRKVLAKDEKLKGWGVDTILIGSYKRSVSIKRLKDVDVFSKLPDLEEGKTPKDVLDEIKRVLDAEYGSDRVERQERSMKVEFPDYDMHVDCVPARPADSVWEIPNGSDGWVETNPEKLTDLSSEMNSLHEHAGQGMYVPMVKLVRQTRAANLGEAQPGGLYFEILTYWAFDSGNVSGGSRAEFFVTTLEEVSQQLEEARVNGLKDPTLDDATISTRASEAELKEAAEVFAKLAKKARQAFDEDDTCVSAKLYREVLGSNEDGEVFPLPSYCNADGTHKTSRVDVIPGEARVPAGDDRFA